jgi:AcrR family transcriptional regulator
MVGRKIAEDERRRSILQAAAAQAGAVGLGALTVRDVAARAEVSPGLVFFHFRSKSELLGALLDDVLARTLDAHEPQRLRGHPAWTRLSAMIRTELVELPAQREQVELLFDFYFGNRDPAHRAAISRALARYQAVFRPVCAEVASGSDLDGAALAATVVALVQGAAIQAIHAPETFDPEALISSLAELGPPGRSVALPFD